MSNQIAVAFYRTLSDPEKIKELGFTLNILGASYNDQGTTCNLKVSASDSGLVEVTDEQMKWNIADCGLILNIHIDLKSPSSIYGPRGIASSGSKVGLALTVSSLSSNRQECISVTEIEKQDSSTSLNHTVSICPGLYLRDFNLQAVLYLISSSSDEVGFASIPGTVLGTLDKKYINAPFTDLPFPIYKVDEPNGPLWWTECRWTDASEDLFTEENVCIRINRLNKYYDMVNIDNKNFSKPLISEIISAAVQLMLDRAMQNEGEWNKIITEPNLPEGTVAAVLRNMYDTFQWDFSSEEKLARSIREFIYTEVEKW